MMMKFNLLMVIGLIINSILFGQTKETHTYAVKDGEELKMDIYFPGNFDQNTSFPMLVWMHGGGFSGGSRDAPDEVKLCEEIAKRNYIAVSISYRLTRKGMKEGFGCDCPAETKIETFQKASEDYLDAVQYLVNHQNQLQIDANQIIAGGSSAGAEGILNALFMKDKWFGNRYENIKFSGLISLAGAAVQEIQIIEENAIPAVFFHGAEDKTVPYETNPHHFCEKNKAGYLVLKGSKSIVEEYENLNQSYFLFTSLNGKHEWSGIPFEYLNQIFEFLRLTLEKKKFLTIEINID